VTSSAIRLLLIDDDRIQHSPVARSLATLGEHQFSIWTATIEEEAICSDEPPTLFGGFDGETNANPPVRVGQPLDYGFCLRVCREDGCSGAI
jgi:hypothetical protein